MNKLRLIAIAVVFSMVLQSCDKKDNTIQIPDTSRFISNYDFFLTGAQQIPANSSAGQGRIEGTYDKRTKLYTYKITWSGLSSNATAMHIHGVAERGFTAVFIAPLAAYPNGIVQDITGFAKSTSGSLSGTLYVDGLVVKEADLLNGKLYVDIHTTNFPNGEIRGQIIFPI
jgi:hypothetical protein